jgi:hypothetical protein
LTWWRQTVSIHIHRTLIRVKKDRKKYKTGLLTGSSRLRMVGVGFALTVAAAYCGASSTSQKGKTHRHQ